MDHVGALDPQEFPRIARDMGFNFSLRRGRVDWQKIDAIDLDLLVQQRDLARLQDNLVNIVNYNVDHEYDLKVLDAGFVKLFKLAQLAVDYLMYSERHLYNCVQLVQQQLAATTREVERLRQECRKKDDNVKNMRRQLQQRDKKMVALATTSTGAAQGPVYSCTHCQKAFISLVYLEAHHTRRHRRLPFTQASPTHAPSPPPAAAAPLSASVGPVVPRMIEELRKEVCQLKDTIAQREVQSQKASAISAEAAETEGKAEAEEKADERTEWEEAYEKKMEEWEEKYREELSSLKLQLITEVKNAAVPNQELLELVQQKEQEIKHLKAQSAQEAVGSRAAAAQEREWQAKLASLEQHHREDMAALQRTLLAVQGQGQGKDAEYASTIRQLVVQGQQIRELLEQRNDELHRLRTTSPPAVGAPVPPRLDVTHVLSLTVDPEDDEVLPAPRSEPQHIPSCAAMLARHLDRDAVACGPPTPPRDAPAGPEKKPARRRVAAALSTSDASEDSEASSPPTDGGGRPEETPTPPPHEVKLDVELALHRRLRELAIDPEWCGLPAGTLGHKMVVLQHQQGITAKRLPSYHHIRRLLIQEAEARLHQQHRDIAGAAEHTGGRATAALPDAATTLGKFVSSVRARARGVFRQSKVAREGHPVVMEADTLPRSLAITMSSAAESQQGADEHHPQPAASSTPSSRSEGTRLLMEPESSGDDDGEEEVAVADEEWPRRPTGFHDVVLSTPGTSPPASPPGTKSSLKSSTSTGQLAKKRVLFADRDMVQQIPSMESGDDVTATSTSPIPDKATDRMAVGRSGSWDSPSKVTVPHDGDHTDTESDWEEFSSQSSVYTKTVTADHPTADIQLNSHRSNELHLISKTIEGQLKHRHCKPASGIPVIFSGLPPADMAATSDDVSTLASSASGLGLPPVPRPRTQTTPTLASHTVLSDWDLEDLE